MLPDRWNRDKFKEAINSPDLFIKELRRLPLHTKKELKRKPIKIASLLHKSKYDDPINIMEEDWDNIIILDACRYDYFEQQNTIQGELTKVTSIASGTTEFVKKTFGGDNFHDTVCVSPNTKFIKYLEPDTFYKLINDIGYDPQEVLNAGIRAAGEFPNKRIIIHFMTPHTPYIGPRANEIWNKYRAQNPPIDSSLIKAARFGYITDEELKEAYSENLDIVLEYVKTLLDNLEGKTVITADHGELLGEKVFGLKDYDHKMNYYVSELRHVPWLEIDTDERRTIVKEKPIDSDYFTDEKINERLRALGYKA